MLALLASAAVSGLLARPLARLAEATTGLPERLPSGAAGRGRAAGSPRSTRWGATSGAWRAALEERFQELTSTGAALGERSEQLAAANRELQSEVAERRRAEWALRLLAEAGSALAASLEPQTTLERIARGCVPGLADWALASLGAGGAPPQLAVAHRTGEQEARLRELAAATPPLVDGDGLDEPLLLADPLDATIAGGDGIGRPGA